MDNITLAKTSKLYKSISNIYGRNSVFEYNMTLINHCENMSWFALTFDKANYYNNSESTVYTFHLKKCLKLLDITSKKNLNNFIKRINTIKDVNNLFVIYNKNIKDLNYDVLKHFNKYKYMHMDIKNKAIYEYMFAFGFLTVKEQGNFVKLILKLQEYGLIDNIKKIKTNILINNSMIQRLSRLLFNTWYNNLPEQEIGHRYSLYQIDINVVSNLCVLYHKKYDGYILQTDKSSYWHKNMDDLSEILIFNINNIF